MIEAVNHALPHRKRRWLSKVLLILVVVAYVACAWLKPLPAITHSIRPLDPVPAGTVSLPWPAYGEAAFGAVGYGVLATHGAQTPLPTASIAKVMTALCVLKAMPLEAGQQGPNITITQADVDSYNKYLAEDGSVAPVNVGEHLSEYQALQALLLPSANNIAETLARWAFGSIDAYTTYANNYATSLGLDSVKITDPSGFLPSTVASANDLTILGITALKNPVIADIASQPSATLPVAGVVQNVNFLLGSSGTIGIKTGNNDQDLGAYLFAAKQTVGTQTITVVGAIMDGPNLPTVLRASLPLINSTVSNFVSLEAVDAHHQVGTYHVPWQGDVAVQTKSSLGLTLWKGERLDKQIILTDSVADGRTDSHAGSRAGLVAVKTLPRDTLQTVPVELRTNIEQPSLWWRLTHVF